MNSANRIRRIWVVGVPGSGKSTLATLVAKALGIAHVEMDALYWEPDWTHRDDSFLEVIAQELSDGSWVADGDYDDARPHLEDRFNLLVWMDPPGVTSAARLVQRTVRRLITRELFCGGNQESMTSVFGSKSIFLHAARSHRNIRHRCNQLMTATLAQPGKVAIRVSTPDLATAMSQVLEVGWTL